MNKSFWNLLLVSPAILGLSTVTCGGAIAVEAPATAVANQLATAQPSESIAALVAEPVAETVAAAPAVSETLAINSSSATSAPTSEPAIAPAKSANSTDAEKLAKIEPDTSSAAVTLPQASDLAVQSSLNQAIANTQLPTAATTKAAKVEVAQTAPAELSNPIVPAAPQAISTEQSGAMSQVTSVSQLSDVRPTDWAFQALQ